MEAQQKMAGESLLPKHVELLTPFSYSATKKPKVRPNYRLLLGLVGVTIILGWLLILTIATFKERKSFAQELLSGNELMESVAKGVSFEPQRDRRNRAQRENRRRHEAQQRQQAQQPTNNGDGGGDGDGEW